MAEPTVREQLRTLRKFMRFALPQWKLILATFLATGLTSLSMGALLLLVKPVVGGWLEGGVVEAGVQETTVTPADGRESAPNDVSRTLWVDDLKARVSDAVASWGPIRRLTAYIAPGPKQLVHVAYLMLGVVAPVWAVMAFLSTFCAGRAVWGVVAHVRSTVFEKLSGMPLSFFSSHRTGDLTSRLTVDVHSMRQAAMLIFADFLKDPFKLVMLLGLALFLNWRLALVAFVGLPPIFLVARRYGGRIQKYGRKSLAKIGDITDAIIQMLSGIRVVKAFGMEDQENADFQQRNREHLGRAFKLVRSRALSGSLPQFFLMVAIGLTLLAGDFFLKRKVIDALTLGQFVGAVLLMPSPMKQLVKSYGKLREHMGAMERVFELLDHQVDLQDHPDAQPLQGVRGGILFDHVWFAYPGEDYVLEDIHLEVPVGTVCAIVGETGAGKSTMLDMLPRFYDPQQGAVRIDGVPVSRLTRESLLRHVAIVSQHPFLFNRSIAENIRYGRRDATDEEVMAAARAAQIHEFLDGLPDGYETMAGERGARLSGGQRQCITIARALLRDAPILILDEATSSLDSGSERLVQRAMNNLMEGRTVFVIAHRLSTVRYADKIVALKAGRIVEVGTHAELLARGGEYARLHRLQFSEPETVCTPADATPALRAQEEGSEG